MVDFVWENLFRQRDRKQSIRGQLKENVLFQDLNFRELAMLENIINVRTYQPGENIFKQGEVGVGMYLIISGIVNLYTEEIEASTSSTVSTHVTQLEAADFFGELALVEHEGRRSASALAHSECVLIGFFKPDLIEIVERNPNAGVKILMRLGEVLGARLKKTTGLLSTMKKDLRK